jgi:CBS domain-containing protein
MAEREIRTIMSRDMLIFRETTPMRDAIAKLVEGAQPLACVCGEEGGLLGVLTPKDCFTTALNASYYQQWSGVVADHMTRTPRTLPADTDIIAAAETFQTDPFRAYPITDNGALVGVLSRHDLLRAFLDLG